MWGNCGNAGKVSPNRQPGLFKINTLPSPIIENYGKDLFPSGQTGTGSTEKAIHSKIGTINPWSHKIVVNSINAIRNTEYFKPT
ncbi:MAG TPA: hypothetical protein PLL88_09140 [Anaerolineaceae bacterium]|jgi:hypothetical protein|nr:hypothetical protein [Anaerolineaceae bacterium]